MRYIVLFGLLALLVLSGCSESNDYNFDYICTDKCDGEYIGYDGHTIYCVAGNTNISSVWFGDLGVRVNCKI